MGVSAPPLPRPGTFGRGEPASPFTGLSVEWDRWRLTDPPKAKAFSKHDWEALASFQTAGRIAEALSANLDFVDSSLEVDSEAAAVLCHPAPGAGSSPLSSPCSVARTVTPCAGLTRPNASKPSTCSLSSTRPRRRDPSVCTLATLHFITRSLSQISRAARPPCPSPLLAEEAATALRAGATTLAAVTPSRPSPHAVRGGRGGGASTSGAKRGGGVGAAGAPS